MDEKYLSLFESIAESSELIAEQVMELDHTEGDENAVQNAERMRNDFRALKDKIKAEPDNLDQAEYGRIFVGAMVVLQSLEKRIQAYQASVTGYKTDLIPKLQRILSEAKTPEEAKELASTLFKNIEEKN